MSKPASVSDLIQEAIGFALPDWGDEVERQSAVFVAEHLPAYQKFWRLFVFPFRVPNSIWLRRDLVPAHEAVCIHNYSLFRASLRAFNVLEDSRRRHAGVGEVGSDHFYDFCIWLDIAYQRAAHLAGALYFYLCEPTDTTRRSLKAWDDHASKFDSFLGSDIRQRTKVATDEVRWYRNRIAHGPKFPGAEDRVLRKDEPEDFFYWSIWADAAEGSRAAWLTRTVPRLDLIEQMWRDFSALMNEFWGCVIKQTRANVPRLPDHEKVELPDITGITLRADGSIPASQHIEILPSGIVTPSR